ncbi:Predicted DNA binding protein, contains HTH domain [Halovenus aranensis]|jgi:predicted DNA binding protein|uniref:Predicted DNA binding protein, contains HTH domain n=1 Tax=Halovenus aranensis TaxID=890420 RepID=A0A1G8YGC9_9EURY|nr:helix-turn-helix domain-containing protein [Halovenus aranensis]SDK01474.1 Predicted DNA binding protein, contains HTH domain [Halovenus aranensis]
MIAECLVVEFEVEGDDCPLAAATRATDARIEARPPQLREDGNVLLQFSAPTDEALRETLDDDDRIRYLHVADGRQEATYRCLSKHPCVVHELVSAGCMVESLQYEGGRALVMGAVVGRTVLQGVMERAGDTVGVKLRRAYQLQSESEPSLTQQWDITPKQEACIQAALEVGYFDVPREATAQEVADHLDISKSAFLERLHRAERTLFRQLFL